MCGLQSLLATLFLICLCATAHGQSTTQATDATLMPDASLNEQVLDVPGDKMRPVSLQVTVFKPNGPGPFPLVIMNHGSDGSKLPRLTPRYRITFSADYFLSRGYAVVLPMMRGFAGSGGRLEVHGCDLEMTGLNSAKDIRAVLDYMVQQSYIDGKRIVMAGQSFGGWNTLAFGALDDSRVRGLINFSGGISVSNCPTSESHMASTAGYFGSHTNVPSIWFYGDNDRVFSPATWHAMYDRYTEAGGKAELVAYGNFMSDSHNLLGFPEGLQIWAPKVDAFLSKVDLPSKITHPEYLPVDFPPATNFAAIDDVDAVPYLNDEGRKTYRKFLADPMPKVFLFSPAGLAASFNGGFDPLGRAMNACQQHAQKCQVYAVDNYVTWVRPTPAPATTNFASINDVAAVPYLNAASRQGYERYLTLKRPKAFVIAPDGAWFFSSMGEDPLANAMASCKKAHQGCRLYAVDSDVVWPLN